MKPIEEVNKLIDENMDSVNLKKHVLAVAECMKFYATKFDGDELLWYETGLLHDIDYDRYPQTHPQRGVEMLKKLGYDDRLLKAIENHAKPDPQDFETMLDKTLWACDEITGFVTSVTLVKPSKKLADVYVDSVKKKMKEKSFSRPVSRDDLRKGAEILGITFEEHVQNVLNSMSKIADKLGL